MCRVKDTTIFHKKRKINSDFCLNFYAGEYFKKGERCATNLKFE